MLVGDSFHFTIQENAEGFYYTFVLSRSIFFVSGYNLVSVRLGIVCLDNGT